MVERNTKVCSTCGKELEIRYFSYRTDSGKYRDQCKKCHKGYKSDRFFKQENDLKLLNEGKKYCGMCGEIKTLDQFTKDKNTRFGYSSRCKQCIHKITSSEHKIYKEKIIRIKKRYNGSDEDVERIMNSHTCEICGAVFNSKVHKHVDHDHSTGKIRGTLCNLCNMGLGSFRDNEKLIAQSIIYLKKYKSAI